MCVSQSPCLCSDTLFRMCTCISTWIYVHLTACHLVHPLCILWCQVGCPCMAVCLCPSHIISVPTPCLECVPAISTWIYVHLTDNVTWCTPLCIVVMETWVPLYGSVFVSQSSYFCCHTLFRMCTCISTCIYVHLTPHISSTTYVHSYMESIAFHKCNVCMFQSVLLVFWYLD